MKLLCNQECIPQQSKKSKGSGWTVLTSVIFLFMPKCALCWAAYMSILSSVGIVIKYQKWFLPVALVLFLLTLIKLVVTSIRKRNFTTVALALGSALIIFSERSEMGWNPMKMLAIAMMIAAILLDKFIALYRARLHHHAEAA